MVFTKKTLFLITSLKTGRSLQIIGVLVFWASTNGKPNPSHKEKRKVNQGFCSVVIKFNKKYENFKK